jgi:hypothetical protein
VVWSFLYVALCRLFQMVVLLGRSERSKELEILVLRHEPGDRSPAVAASAASAVPLAEHTKGRELRLKASQCPRIERRARPALALSPLLWSRSSSSPTDKISRRRSVISSSPATSSRANCAMASAS